MTRLSEQSSDRWQRRIGESAASFPYPDTPDVTGAVRQQLSARQRRPTLIRQRLAWWTVLLPLIMGALMAVPQVRAAVLRIIRAGAITIFVSEPTPTTAPDTVGTSSSGTTAVSSTATPRPADEYIFELASPITLAEAHDHANMPLQLPSYPADLGPPDKVYFQETDWQAAIIFIWLNPVQTDEVRLSLYHIEVDDYAYKAAKTIEVTRVNGREAFWLEAPHNFRMQNGRYVPWLFVEGSVLIWWTSEGVTYRLESGLTLAEAVRIAESLK